MTRRPRAAERRARNGMLKLPADHLRLDQRIDRALILEVL